MKQKLLYFILSMLFSATIANAQTKTWNFSSGWPEVDGFAGYTACSPPTDCAVTVDNLTIIPHTSTSNMGQIETKSLDFGDGFTSVVRFKTNGGAGGTPELPVRRYLTFPVSGAVDVTIWAAAGGSGLRNLYLSDGTTLLGTLSVTDEQDVPKIFSASYTGGPATLYISGDQNYSLYKIEVDGVGADILGVNDFKSPVTTNLKSFDGRIYVSNVTTNTEINIYSITGALVKTFKTSTDTDFSFKTGLWIATAKTDEGQKVVKLVVQ